MEKSHVGILVLTFLLCAVVFVSVRGLTETDSVINSSPKVQQILSQIEEAEKHDLLVDRDVDVNGKEHIQVFLIYHGSASSKTGNHVAAISRPGRMAEDMHTKTLSITVDRIVKTGDIDYDKFAGMFVRQ